MVIRLSKISFIILCLCLLISIGLYAQDPNLPPGINFNLSAWKLQTLNEDDNSFIEVQSPEILEVHSSRFFFTDTTDGAMVFRVPSNGGTTSSGTNYPRVELRQLKEGGNWPLADLAEHYLSAECKVIEVAQAKPKTIIGQIHGSETNSELLKIRWTGYKPGECFVEARFQTNDAVGSEYGIILATNLSLGDIIDYTITMKSGLVWVTVNGNSATQTYTNQFYGTTDHYYFKAGNYIQWNDGLVSAPPIVYGENKFYKLMLTKETQTGTNNPVSMIDQFEIYPNPAGNFVNLDLNFSTTSAICIEIYNSYGKIRRRITFPSFQSNNWNTQQINLADLSPGIYYIRLSTKHGSETKKLIIFR